MSIFFKNKSIIIHCALIVYIVCFHISLVDGRLAPYNPPKIWFEIWIGEVSYRSRCCSSSFCCCCCCCCYTFLLPPDCHFFFLLFLFGCAVAVAVVCDMVQHHKSRARFDCQPPQLPTPFRHPILFTTNQPASMRQLLLSHIAKYASEWNDSGLNPSMV
jgi:hypothetical protein